MNPDEHAGCDVEPDPAIFWAQAREMFELRRAHGMVLRHLVVDRFVYDPGEVGFTTDQDGDW